MAVDAGQFLGGAVASTGARAAASMDRIREQSMALLEMWLKAKLHKVAVHICDKLPDLTKSCLEDPDMPRFVSRGKDRIVDALWPDVREELVWELAVMIDGKASDDEPMPEQACPVDCVRAFLRYHLLPYDRTIWGKLRDPIWVIFTLVSLVPIAGICPMVYLFMFLLIDKGDEYQLISYILQFKGTQYLSHGLLRLLIGFALFIACVTVPANADGHQCEKSGPGQAGDFTIIVGTFAVQIVLVWLAFFLLPCAKEKGRSTLKTLNHTHGQIASSAGKMGGYLRGLMIYDLVCFIMCMGVTAWVASTREKFDDWPVRHALFACQIVYGFLSLPFFIFTIPYIQAVLTHSVPTGYDRKGRVRAYKRPENPQEKDKQSRGSIISSAVSSVELGSLVDSLKAIYTDQASALVAKGAALRARAGSDPAPPPQVIGGEVGLALGPR